MVRRPDRRVGLAAALAAGIACVVAAGCAAPRPGAADPRASDLPLDAWLTMIQDPAGAVRPCVRVAAPYHSLVFARAADGFTSGLEVQVVARRSGTQVGGGVGSSRVVVGDYAATRSTKQLEVAAPLRLRGDEPVTLEVAARVTGTSRVWYRQLAHEPRVLAAMPVWIAAVHTNLEPAANGGHVLAAGADSLRLEIVLQRQPRRREWPAGGLDLVTEVSGPDLERPRRQRSAVAVDVPDPATLVQVWPRDSLPFGQCRLQIVLESVSGVERLQLPREPALTFVNLQVPWADDRAWKRHLVWLDDLVSTDARDALRDLPAADRAPAWTAVWDSLGRGEPGGGVEAQRRHLQRIVDADDRFGGFGRGALSDRGRTYIRWGEPARIEVVADARTPGASWEIWVYPGLGRRFLFFDANGLGDYRLQREEPFLD
ncbi:MAG TPA: GWxTD domain-containing protein [Candidatus Krumholzibacteria bacterium]|nr:GWxTD domain-containing protein [Candidatus Krumholzibacteria bacterium]HPD71353.1 GWxTD domain-containing protein [Candidatus Krumholzibacteria bacterium]HRY38947.1 GWxTD domain-containing protein [Candidatus Krumholzibacteria bacterium]